MLIYANHLTLQGSDAPDAIFRAVGKWLEEKLGYHPKELKIESRHEGMTQDNIPSTLKIYAALDDAIEYYAWVLRHSHKYNKDWKWTTEIGVKLGDGFLDISFVLRVDGMSTRADSLRASQPRVVPYVIDEIRRMGKAKFKSSVPGFKVKKAGKNSDTYRALLVDIEKENRKYPYILVSPTAEGKYLLKINDLQKKLVGLAQVVKIDHGFNIHEMEKILGKLWSVNEGAVNILQTPNQFKVRNRFFRPEKIESWGDKQDSRISEVLSWVTHETNIPYFRDRIRPEKIAQLSMRQQSENYTGEMIDKYKEERDEAIRQRERYVEWTNELLEKEDALNSEIEKLTIEFLEKEEGLNSDLNQRNEQIENLETELYNKKNIIESLDQKENTESDRVTSDSVNLLIDVLCEDKLTPSRCLDVIEEIHGSKCVILETAKKSAKKSNFFEEGRKLLKQLIKLVTKYREVFINEGDEKAKDIFGRDEYAARESRTVENNRKLRKKRTFEYNGEQILMLQHLKIGVDDDKRKIIRTHFCVKDEIIVIGHCGPHLPLK